MTTPALSFTDAIPWDDLRGARKSGVLAELRAMSEASGREEGLLNYAQAALTLEISAPRVAELVSLGKLSGFKFFGRTYVSVREVLARREADIKAGRPKRNFVQRLKVTGGIMAKEEVLTAVTDLMGQGSKKKGGK
jgi:hypothetical protein